MQDRKKPTLIYTIAMPEPVTHLFQVSIRVTGPEEPGCTFLLPTWTPGSYLIREFARHVQGFAAYDEAGAVLPWRKTAKDAWEVTTRGAAEVVVTYQVYAHDLTVRTSHLDTTHGYFNGANVFMAVEGARDAAVELVIEPYPGWEIATPLDPIPATGNHFHADDYDHLIDSPTEVGTHQLVSFEALGKPHRIAFYGHGNEDLNQLARDTQRIVEAAGAIFGGLPYAHYLFILHAIDVRGGGLEHRNSSSNAVVRWSFADTEQYRERVLALLAHEFFHVWNVKRIVPEGFLAYDYRRENYTGLLWVMEGWTSYFELLILRRAGLWSARDVLVEIARRILRLQQTPGRHVQSLEMASFDAWIKFYRPDENTQNTSISYYLKGALVAMLLDLQIRHVTEGARSLDDVMRTLWHAYAAQGRGLPEAGFQAIVEDVVGQSLDEFFTRCVRGVDELPFAEMLAQAGLELRFAHKIAHDQRSDTEPRAGLGLRIVEKDGRTEVDAVFADGACGRVDIAPGDELLALDGFRVRESTLRDRLDERQPGDLVTLTLFRRDELRQVTVTLGTRAFDHADIVPLGEANAAQRARYEQWLNDPFPGSDFDAAVDLVLEPEKPRT